MPVVRVLAAVAVMTAAACTASGNAAVKTPAPKSTTTTASTPSPHPTKVRSTTTPPPSPAELRKRAAREVAAISAKQPRGAVSVAAVNLATGAHFSAGQKRGMWTASAYKLFVLETLMLENGTWQSGDAQLAIENSDNAAGYRLFLATGGNGALASAARTFGMRHTVPGVSDPTFTRTSASDFLILVRNLVDKDSPLQPSARHYLLGLMSNVEADQRWGVGAAADKDTTFYNKNGWLSIDDTNGPGETDDGRWAVTSVGLIRVHGQRVAMAVFTQHQPDMGTGVRLVQKLAKAITPAVSG